MFFSTIALLIVKFFFPLPFFYSLCITTMTERKVRVRFAPSPTGPLHIGGVRTALYNYLFAKQHGGDLIFRIEDTDSTRFVPGAEDYIIESFKWLGIKFDEGVSFGGEHGPYRQSERRDIYKKYVKQLLDNGKAYIAFDTPEELNAKRAETENFQYDASTRGMMRNSLTMAAEEVENLIKAGEQYVVRFKIEPGHDVVVDDMIRGKVTINSSILDDKVLYKSADELPTYHLANIVDDHLMEVTHVIRGEEWLPSAPLHVLLYEAFGWADTMPRFAHLPLLTGTEGKLSKRLGSLGVRELKADGVEAMAICSFLAKLGTSDAIEPYYSLDELAESLDFSKLGRSQPKFDEEELKHFNTKVVRSMPYALVKDRIAADETFWNDVRANLNVVDDVKVWEDICHKEVAPIIEDKALTDLAAELLPAEPWNENTKKRLLGQKA